MQTGYIISMLHFMGRGVEKRFIYKSAKIWAFKYSSTGPDSRSVRRNFMLKMAIFNLRKEIGG